jgi:rubrerythrin
MAGFADPFPGIIETKPMSRDDTIRALRLDLAAEEEAIHLYTAHADATDDLMVQTILKDIADEERKHSGELLALIASLTNETDFLVEGSQEVQKRFPAIKAGYPK